MPALAERKRISARLIHDCFLQSAEARSVREKAWENDYRRSHPSWVDERVPEPRIKLAKVYRYTRTKLSWLMRHAKANGCWVRAHARGEFRDAAEAVSGGLNGVFEDRKLGNPESMLRGARKGLKYGDQWWMTRWHDDGYCKGVRIVNLATDDVFPDFFGGRWVIVRRHVRVADLAEMARTLSAPVMEPMIDPATGEPATDANGERIMVPVIGKDGKPVERDGGVARKALAKVVALAEEGRLPERYGWHWFHASRADERASRFGRVAVSGDAQLVRTQDDPANAMVTLLEYHERGGPDYAVAKVLPDVPDGMEREDLFFQLPTPSRYRRCQMTRWTPNWEDDEEWGYGLGEIVGKQADMADFAARQGANLLLRLCDPAMKHHADERLPTEILRNPSGQNIPLMFPEHFGYVDPPSRQDAAIVLQQMMGAGMQEALGESEQRQGIPADAPATNAAIAEMGGQADDLLNIATFFMAVEEIAETVLAILRKHVDSEFLIPVLGGDTPSFARLLPEHLDDSIRFIIKVGGSLWGANPAYREQVLTRLGTNFADVTDRREIALRIARETGMPDPDALVVRPEGPDPVDPGIENEILWRGGSVEVSPRENLREHWVKHTAFERQAIAAGAPPETVAAIAQHRMETEQSILYQQQFAAQGMGAGGMGTKPVEAGPGQPQAVNERTAAVNDMRQMSNRGSPGSAPGGSITGGRAPGTFARGPGR